VRQRAGQLQGLMAGQTRELLRHASAVRVAKGSGHRLLALSVS